MTAEPSDSATTKMAATAAPPSSDCIKTAEPTDSATIKMATTAAPTSLGRVSDIKAAGMAAPQGGSLCQRHQLPTPRTGEVDVTVSHNDVIACENETDPTTSIKEVNAAACENEIGTIWPAQMAERTRAPAAASAAATWGSGQERTVLSVITGGAPDPAHSKMAATAAPRASEARTFGGSCGRTVSGLRAGATAEEISKGSPFSGGPARLPALQVELSGRRDLARAEAGVQDVQEARTITGTSYGSEEELFKCSGALTSGAESFAPAP